MRFELFVALRYLLGRRKQTFISVISIISVVGVALGVAALIIVMGVMNGFTTDLREKIMGVNAHAMVLSGTNSMPAFGFDTGKKPETLDSLQKKVLTVPGVTGAMPFIYAELMISGPAGVKGLVMRGVDPVTAPKVLTLVDRITQGKFEDIAKTEGLPGIVVGKELANRIGASVGSRVNLLTPTGDKGAAGFTPRIRSAKVVGIFSTGMFEYDSSLALVSLESAREFLGRTDADWVTGLELTVSDVYKADRIAESAALLLGSPYYVRNWMEMNASLFAALKLEKLGMAIMLTLIILVASFSIVTTLVMLVMEKTRDIAILMSMGATRRSIRRIFMLQGLIIGGVGTGTGFALGLGICQLLQRYQFIKLPKGVYSLDYLPILLQWSDLVSIAVGAVLLCFVATLYPARQAAGLEPADALRYE